MGSRLSLGRDTFVGHEGLIEAHDRKCVFGHGLFDGEGNCTAVLRAIMVSLNEETHRATPFDPAVRTALDRLAASADGLPV